ncbi:MAG: exodeoxyribonuclease VII small subunit [Burkholderiales bacterium]
MPKAATKTPTAALPPAGPTPVSYEAALEELEQLLQRLEASHTPLDQLLASYQRGNELLKFCRQRLDVLEQQVKVLDDGVLKPWSESP